MTTQNEFIRIIRGTPEYDIVLPLQIGAIADDIDLFVDAVTPIFDVVRIGDFRQKLVYTTLTERVIPDNQ